MNKEIWLNLPVKNIKKSKEFFSKLGFEFSQGMGNTPVSACLLMGNKQVPVMLFEELQFKSFTQTEITDTKTSSEMMISLDAESREEVDEIVKKAETAGANVFGKPLEIQGWMYGCGFQDLDGHRWNVLYMDMDKMPKS